MNPNVRIRHILLPVLILFLSALPVRAECSHEYVPYRLEPTCVDYGMSCNMCIHCGDTLDYIPLPPTGHTFDEWYLITEPGCSSEGTEARDCVTCGFREERTIPHTGHAYIVEIMPPTCTARGYTSHYCPGCGDRFRTDYTDALGHRYDRGTITKEPTEKTMGRMRFTCQGCSDTYEDMIPALTNPFCDIAPDTYYTTPVLWASGSGITTGIDDTHFAPDLPCTRAQIVTFLWRRAGKPTPVIRENPFTDVPAGSFYELAVLWAFESGITTGTDAHHFSPGGVCNRAQVVTFLHRFRGCPEPFPTVSFPDVPAGSFFHDAVLWAAQKEITLGMDGGYFRPSYSCNRAQIVTFLYRDAKVPDRR